MRIQLLKQSKGFTFIELMVAIAIVGLLAAIAIPNYISYRNKAYCSEAETNANQTAGAIADYYGMGHRTRLPTKEDLNLRFKNPLVISGDPNTTISIEVTDSSNRCPEEYQNSHGYWSDFVFTKYVR